MGLNEKDKTKIIELIKASEKLPKEFIYKLFNDEEDVFLFWNGRKEDVTNVALPFHSIEHIDEPRKGEDDGIIGRSNALLLVDNRSLTPVL